MDETAALVGYFVLVPPVGFGVHGLHYGSELFLHRCGRVAVVEACEHSGSDGQPGPEDGHVSDRAVHCRIPVAVFVEHSDVGAKQDRRPWCQIVCGPVRGPLAGIENRRLVVSQTADGVPGVL